MGDMREKGGEPHSDKVLARLISYGSLWRSKAVKATSFSVLNKIFDIFPEILIGIAVDLVVQRDKSFIATLGFHTPLQQLVAIGTVTGIIWALESVFEYLYSVEWRNLAQELQHTLRMDAYSHLQRLDPGWFSEKSTGDILSILNDDVNQLERFLDSGVNEIIQVVVSSVVISAIFFWLSPVIACFAILPIPLILTGSFLFQKRLHSRYVRVRKMAGRLGARISNNIHGIETIKSYTTEQYESDAVQRISREYQSANRSAIILSSMVVPVIRFAILSGFMVTLIMGGWYTFQGTLAVGSYSILVFLTQRLLWPFTRLGQTFDLYQRAMASAHRVLSLLETEIHITDNNAEGSYSADPGSVRFSGVSFAYLEGRKVLRDINLDISRGEFVGIVGTTGCGKSTLIRLLLRFYEADEGCIYLNGCDTRELGLKALRRQISVVSQDVFLFDGTVFENIAYGNPEMTTPEVITAAKEAEAHDFIDNLPEGYNTMVGENGMKLSGGQRQKISIARALLKNSSVIIFDEATSSVDNETEASIQRSMSRIRSQRTMIVIAHRLSTVRQADKIIVLGQGKILESGSHEELLKADGTYARLWNIQTGHLVSHPPSGSISTTGPSAPDYQ